MLQRAQNQGASLFTFTGELKFGVVKTACKILSPLIPEKGLKGG